jgi:hypothetical protein
MQSSDAYAGSGLSFDHFHAKIQSLHVEVEELLLDVHRDCLAECLDAHDGRQTLDDAEKDDVESKLGVQPADEGAPYWKGQQAPAVLLVQEVGGRRTA